MKLCTFIATKTRGKGIELHGTVRFQRLGALAPTIGITEFVLTNPQFVVCRGTNVGEVSYLRGKTRSGPKHSEGIISLG
jgi:hypothetical protein